MRLGVLWGYPFSLVRRLFVAFVFLVALGMVAGYALSDPIGPTAMLLHILPVAIAILLSMYVAELVGVTERPLPPISLEQALWAVATSCLALAGAYAVLPTYGPSTLVASVTPIASVAVICLHRKWKDARGVQDAEVPGAVFAGTRRDLQAALAGLAAVPGLRIRVAVLPESETERTPLAGIPIETPRQIVETFRRTPVQVFVVGEASEEHLHSIVMPCAGTGCVIETVDELIAKTQGRVNLVQNDVIGLLNRISTRATQFSAQRLIDLVIVTLISPVALALGIFVALAVRFTSRGKILFRQERVGRRGRDFTILKFRTMDEHAEKHTGPVWAKTDDSRITTVGNFLRRTRLDELPQLWNVIRGEMSLVGPRPERRHFVDQLHRTIPFYDVRHAVRPGLTGWAQVRYTYGATEEDARIKLGYELFYVLNRSLTFYSAVMLETLKVIVFRKGAR